MTSFAELAAIRLGFGLSPLHPPPADAEAVLASVAVTAGRAPFYTAAQLAVILTAEQQRKKAAGADMQADQEGMKAFAAEVARIDFAAMIDRVAQAVGAPVGFGERLVQFWASHFSVGVRGRAFRLLGPAQIEEAVRPNIGGSFAALLKAAVLHPGMLVYLNQSESVGAESMLGRALAARRARDGKTAAAPGINENLARELLELHTLGVGGPYTQDDVRSLAQLLTGLYWVAQEPDRIFHARRAEPGADVVLGKAYGGTRRDGLAAIEDLLDDLAVHPATARHVSRKLAVHFVADEPDPALLAALEAEWRASGGDLMRVYRVLVTHPALAAQFRQKVRQPFDYIAAGLRALGFSADDVAGMKPSQQRGQIAQPMRAMGQPVADVPGPDGWPEDAAAWVQPQMLAERIDWAMNAPSALLARQMPDPRAFVQTALGATASEGTLWAVPKAESVREGVGIVLASADFNRR